MTTPIEVAVAVQNRWRDGEQTAWGTLRVTPAVVEDMNLLLEHGFSKSNVAEIMGVYRQGIARHTSRSEDGSGGGRLNCADLELILQVWAGYGSDQIIDRSLVKRIVSQGTSGTTLARLAGIPYTTLRRVMAHA